MSAATVTTTTATAAAAACASGSRGDQYSLPLVASWKHGMANKGSGTNMSAWLDLAMTLDGRDKITKLLQYISRFLAWYYGGSNNLGNSAAMILAERFANLKVALTNSRKAFRLGRTAMELQKVYGMNVISTLVERYHWQQKQASPSPSPSLVSSTDKNNSNNTIALIGTAMKCLGLAGFWAGDNVNFLASSGVLDDYYSSNDKQQRLQQRKRLATQAGMFANRSYFIGAVAGLVVNARAYWLFRRQARERLKQIPMVELKDDNNNNNNNKNASSSSSSSSEIVFQKTLDEVQEKQFVLMVALVKSCCDVLAFSNNPGVDLWEKYILYNRKTGGNGRKLNEGIHCVAGMLSALTVLYNNFPKQQNKSSNNNKK